MNIGIIGAGLVVDLAHRAGERRGAARVAERDVVLLAVPWRAPEALPAPERVAGKIVIDAMNPYGADSSIVDLGNSTSSEETAKRLPGARIVKAFNTIYWEHLAHQGRPDLPAPERRAILVAGDDTEAKALVSRLIEEIGFVPVDTGSLREGGRRQQPGTPVYNQVLTGTEAERMLETHARTG
jgi:predicted dinucleotide-binding enzyme